MACIRLKQADGRVVEFQASPVRSVLVSSQLAGLVLRHDCGGKALCGTCRVRVLEGRVNPPEARELARLEAVHAEPDQRLACQLRPASDLSLEAVLAPQQTGKD